MNNYPLTIPHEIHIHIRHAKLPEVVRGHGARGLEDAGPPGGHRSDEGRARRADAPQRAECEASRSEASRDARAPRGRTPPRRELLRRREVRGRVAPGVQPRPAAAPHAAEEPEVGLSQDRGHGQGGLP